MSKLRVTLAGVLCAWSLAACGGEEPPPTIAEVEAAFTGSCVFAACHQGASPAGEMSLEAPVFDEIVNVPSSQSPDKVRVAPGDVGGSYLMDKILGRGVEGEQMPPGVELSEGRTELIRRWIEAGAPKE